MRYNNCNYDIKPCCHMGTERAFIQPEPWQRGRLYKSLFLEVNAMTAKQAIKARCKDCLAGSRTCNFDDCALKGLSKSKRGVNRPKAIKIYCKWCLNGHAISVCSSLGCAIYQYRKKLENTQNLPVKPLIIDSLISTKPETVNSYGKGFEAPKRGQI